MPCLTGLLPYWGTREFDPALKRAIEGLAAGSLPLGGVLGQGGLVDDSDISVTVIHTRENGQTLLAKVGVFFTEVVGGCSCGDDPFTQPAYCMLLVTIDRQTASAGFEVIEEPE